MIKYDLKPVSTEKQNQVTQIVKMLHSYVSVSNLCPILDIHNVHCNQIATWISIQEYVIYESNGRKTYKTTQIHIRS